MLKKILVKSIVALLMISCSSDHDAPYTDGETNSVENSSKGCAKRLSGKWNFGQTPYGCQMPSAATRKAESDYAEYVYYPDAKDSKAERKRYVEAMNDFIKATSEGYLLRREPDVTNEAMEAWVLLALSIAHQESYWTHYRIGEDNIFRLLRGDNYHGYGLMQVDDRWHKDFIGSGEVFDLKLHIIYALDLMYSVRTKVLKSPCSGEKNWDNYNRSIYSAYNGGLGSKCRWKNSGSKWYKNDKGFLVKYVKRAWEAFLNIIKGTTEESEEVAVTEPEVDPPIEVTEEEVKESPVEDTSTALQEEVEDGGEAAIEETSSLDESEITEMAPVEEVVDHEG